MTFSERNKKVAMARWKKFHESQKNKIATGKRADYLKSIICGFLAGDGTIQVRKDKNKILHHDLGFFPDDEVMLNEFIKNFEELYQKTPSIRRRDNVFIVRISSKAIIQDIMETARFGIRKWNLPKTLLYNSKNQIAWLRAFFSAEGYVGSEQIKLQTINQNGMREVSNMLKEIGIGHNYYEYPSRIKNQNGVGIISINKRRDRLDFFKKVGFWHAKKTKRIKETLDL